MRISIGCRQNHDLLQKADEIYVELRDIDYIFTLISNYPDKDIVLRVFHYEDIDWGMIHNFKVLSNDRVVLGLSNEAHMKIAKERGFRFYFAEPVSSYYDVEYIKDLGSEYFILEGALFFNLTYFVSHGLKVRARPARANSSAWGFHRTNNIYGSWIRPEDLKSYESYISIIEFRDEHDKYLPTEEEAALYRIYIEQKHWPDDISILIKDIGVHVPNYLLPDTLGLMRIHCRQACKQDSQCRACDRYFELAGSEEKLKDYLGKNT